MIPNVSMRFILLLLLLGQGFALAQRSAQILYFRAPKGAPEKTEIFLQSGEALKSVKLGRNNFGQSFSIPKGTNKLFFLGAPLEEDEKIPVGAPSIKIPESYKKFLILTFKDPDNPVFPVRFQVINASEGSFGKGDRMLVNFTDNRIIGKVGMKKIDLRGKSSVIVKYAANTENQYQVSLNRTAPGQKKSSVFVRQRWRQHSAQRSLIIIYSPAGTNRVTYYNAPVHSL